MSADPDLAATGQPYEFAGDNPINASDPLGLKTTIPADYAKCHNHPKACPDGSSFLNSLVGLVKQHWRGLVQIAIGVGGIILISAACGTGALCAAALGGASSLASYLATSRQRNLSGAFQSFAEGFATGALGVRAAETYGVGVKSISIVVGTGAALGANDYIEEPGPHSFVGVVDAATAGGLLSFPWDHYLRPASDG